VSTGWNMIRASQKLLAFEKFLDEHQVARESSARQIADHADHGFVTASICRSTVHEIVPVSTVRSPAACLTCQARCQRPYRADTPRFSSR
jgi:hypothetical protein